jgi:hypothetical protein
MLGAKMGASIKEIKVSEERNITKLNVIPKQIGAWVVVIPEATEDMLEVTEENREKLETKIIIMCGRGRIGNYRHSEGPVLDQASGLKLPRTA